MLYWLTGSIGSSFRSYYHDNTVPQLPLVEVPAGITLTSEDEGYPLEFALRTYADIRQWRVASRGRHFLALEEPERLAAESSRFFPSSSSTLVLSISMWFAGSARRFSMRDFCPGTAWWKSTWIEALGMCPFCSSFSRRKPDRDSERCSSNFIEKERRTSRFEPSKDLFRNRA